MKRNLKIAVCTMIAFCMLSGCSGKETERVNSGTANANLFDDMKTGEAVDGKTVMQAFSDAMELTDNADSATIESEVNIQLTEDDETTSSKSTSKIQFQPNPDAKTDEEPSTSEADEESGSSEEDADSEQPVPERIVAANIANELNGESVASLGDCYYSDGYVYYSLDDNKVKEAVDYSGFMYYIGNYAIQFNGDVAESAYKVSSKKETKYTVKFDNESIADMMISNMVGGGESFAENETMSVNEAYLYFVVDSDGYIIGYDMELDAQFTTTTPSESEENTSEVKQSPFKYSVVANFTDINSTKVTPPEDIDSYRDVNEVLAEMESEQEENTEQDMSDTEAAEPSTSSEE